MCTEQTEIKAALREYESLNSFYSETYRNYVRCLFFAAIAFGAVFATIVNNDSKNVVEFLKSYGDVLAAAGTLSVSLWFTGWAYLNLELWSYRHYLAKLELYIREKIKMDKDTDGFSFYHTDVFYMYNIKMPRPLEKFRWSDALIICFAIPIILFYIFCAGCTAMYVRKFLSNNDNNKNIHFIINMIVDIFGLCEKSARIVAGCVYFVVLALSILCVFTTFKAKRTIIRKQKKSIRKLEPKVDG